MENYRLNNFCMVCSIECIQQDDEKCHVCMNYLCYDCLKELPEECYGYIFSIKDMTSDKMKKLQTRIHSNVDRIIFRKFICFNCKKDK